LGKPNKNKNKNLSCVFGALGPLSGLAELEEGKKYMGHNLAAIFCN